MTVACAMAFTAFNVKSSGSPGPAPTNVTQPARWAKGLAIAGDIKGLMGKYSTTANGTRFMLSNNYANSHVGACTSLGVHATTECLGALEEV